MTVKVTFLMDETDPTDSTGLTEDDYNAVVDAIQAVGGYDVDFERPSTEEQAHHSTNEEES